MAQTFRQDVNQPAKSEKNLLRTGYTLSHIRQQFSERKLK
jgi:hypothetical protein